MSKPKRPQRSIRLTVYEWKRLLPLVTAFANGSLADRLSILEHAATQSVHLPPYGETPNQTGLARLAIKALFPSVIEDKDPCSPDSSSRRLKRDVAFYDEEWQTFMDAVAGFAALNYKGRVDYLIGLMDSLPDLMAYEGEMRYPQCIRWVAKVFAPACITGGDPNLYKTGTLESLVAMRKSQARKLQEVTLSAK